MIISKAQVQNILKIYARDFNAAKVEKPAAVNPAIKNDELNISRESRLKQKIMQEVKKTDDLRMDKVAELQKKIAGNHEISSDEIAEKIIERAIVDKFI